MSIALRSEPAPASRLFATVTVGPTSTAPLSALIPTTRGYPRWSVTRAVVTAALIAGLPAMGRNVWVLPPLFPNKESRGAIFAPTVPTRSLFAFGIPAGNWVEAPLLSPIRFPPWEVVVPTKRKISVAVVVALLAAMIVFLI